MIRTRQHVEARPSSAAERALVARTRYELVPIKGVEEAIDELPPGARVTVTCSPKKGIPATLELTARCLDAGHQAVPHLSARLVEGPHHVARIAGWLEDHGCREVFVVAGDAEHHVGAYHDGASFLRELLHVGPPLDLVGVPAYPDHHPLIDDEELRDALHAKQALLASAGVAGSATTQLCFDVERVRHWLTAERVAGLELPIELGVPGVVERAKLVSMGVRLGIGQSLRFLRKQRSSLLAMVAPGGYDPSEVIGGLADDAARLGIVGLHAFTFNRVAATRAWQEAVLAS